MLGRPTPGLRSVRYDELGALYAGSVTPVRGHPAAYLPGDFQLREAARAAFLDSELLSVGQAHLDEVLRGRAKTHDGPVAVLDRLDGSTVHTARSGYFAALATGDALRAEWEREGFGPLRARAHELAGGDPLRNGHGRAASLGLAVATLRDGRVLLGRRSQELATDPGHWHTAPSGTFEPERSLADQVAGELEEEIGVSGAEAAKPFGLGFDLPRLRVELCVSFELRSGEFELGEEFVEASWIDPRGPWPEPLAPAAAAVLALMAMR